MAKLKLGLEASKDGLRHPKDGSISKKKSQKFKKTPGGKVTLINGSNNKTAANLKSQKNGSGVQRSPRSPKSHKGGKDAKNGSSPAKSTDTSGQEDEDDDDSDESINEGISIKEEISGQEDEPEDDDDSSDDSAVPDIFGQSLAEETDDSDEEFEADSNAVEEAENKGVKMFKGVEKAKKQAEDDEDDDEDDDDDDDDDDNDHKATLGLSALLGDSLKDESGDEDFVGTENSDEEDDDDDDDDEEDDDEAVNQSLDSSNVTSDGDVENDDEEDEDDDDDDEDDDDDDSSPDLSDLLGNTLVDDSDDDDFEGNEDDEDEDISDEEEDEELSGSLKEKNTKTSDNSTDQQSPENKKKPHLPAEERNEREKRTIYVGNIPKDTQVKTLSKEFKKFGPIANIRIRGIIPEDPKMSLKVAAIKKKFHPKSTIVCAFITYENEESAVKALTMNGKTFAGNYLRVDRSEKAALPDKKKSVFLGNLPFTIEDNELWEAFKDCGRIESVRIVRHRTTGLGRGFGYVNFESADGAVLALSLDGTEICKRNVRVKPVVPETKTARAKSEGKKRHRSQSDADDSPKKVKTEDSESVQRATKNSLNAERRKKTGKKRSQGEEKRGKVGSGSPQSENSQTKFQGQKVDGKKKRKHDKSSKQKKQMAAKLLAKPKKPVAN